MVAGGRLEIVVKECRNLPVHSEKTVLCVVRLEFAGRSLGESSRVEVKEGEPCAVFDFTALLEVPGASQEHLNEMICNPLLLTAVEVHPKDKKSKEEKTSVLGQVAIDLAPVVMEGAQFEGTLQLLQPSTDLAPPTQGGVGVVADVALKVVTPFLPVQEAANSNLLSVRVDSLYSVPEAWLPVSTPGHKFELALAVPSAEELGTTLLLNNGCLRNPPSKDPEAASTHWKWPHLDPECAKVALIDGSPMEPCALEDEDGELTGREEHAFRIRAQKELPRVNWNMEQRSWLSQDTCQRIRKDLAQCPLVPLEVIRMTVPPVAGKGKAKDEEPVPSYHGVAYVNLSSLLYPGVSKVRGAFPVLPYCETEFNDKTKVSSRSHYAGAVARAQAAAALAKTKQGGGKRAASTLKASPADMLQDSEANLSAVESKELTEGQEFKDSRTYILLEVSLQKPLIPRRTAAVLAESVAEYIPPRPAVPKRLGGAERAVKGFQDHCADVVKCLLGEYRDMFGVPSSSANGQDQLEERRRKFLFSLNSSGKYYAFKEDLKRAVVKVVREKFISKSSTFGDPQQLQLFISELYAYLLDQMHTGMSQVLSLENTPQAPPSFTNAALLRLFAAEAEVYGDLALADHYHRQGLMEEDHIADHWYKYGVHCMRCGNVEKGEQCLKQALSLDSSHVPSLILYSSCCALDERFDEGETFLEMATARDPVNAVAWTVTGLFYELCGKAVSQNHSFRQAEICGGSTRQKTLIVPPSTKESETYLSPKLNLKNASSVSQAPAHSLKGTADTFSQASVSASTKPEATVSVVLEEELTEDSTKSKAPLLSSAALDSPSSTKKSLGLAAGDQEGQEDEKPARKLSVSRAESVSMRSDETPTRKANSDLAAPPTEAPTISVYLATANFLLDVGALKFAEMALAHELDQSDNQPSPAYHVARSRYFMARREFENAISSVTVAIKEETENPAAWATLGHIHYLSGDLKEAQPAFERALAFVGDCPEVHSVHLRLGDIYLKSNQFKKAKEVFLLASQSCPSSVTWRGVGIACYRLGELENAMVALCEANILNKHDSTVWAYLTLVSVKTKHLSEAEQAYKFMMHAGMQDSQLLEEVKSVSSAFLQDIL